MIAFPCDLSNLSVFICVCQTKKTTTKNTSLHRCETPLSGLLFFPQFFYCEGVYRKSFPPRLARLLATATSSRRKLVQSPRSPCRGPGAAAQPLDPSLPAPRAGDGVAPGPKHRQGAFIQRLERRGHRIPEPVSNFLNADLVSVTKITNPPWSWLLTLTIATVFTLFRTCRISVGVICPATTGD